MAPKSIFGDHGPVKGSAVFVLQVAAIVVVFGGCQILDTLTGGRPSYPDDHPAPDLDQPTLFECRKCGGWTTSDVCDH